MRAVLTRRMVGRRVRSAGSISRGCGAARRAARTAAAALAVAVAAPIPAAHAGAFLPPAGKRFLGITGGTSASDLTLFQNQVQSHPAVFGFFTAWGAAHQYAFTAAAAAGARPMLHISTTQGYGATERVTPKGIAEGGGDRYLVDLNREIADRGVITYVRFLAEMNQTNNAYCAFNKDGSSRGAAHSPGQFKRAFRRAAIILRGGALADVNAKLRAIGEPAVKGTTDDLATPQVAMAWVPQTAGSPDIPANSAAAYYPGRTYVDWVGTDFYSAFPNFAGLHRFAGQYKGIPFMFGELAAWKSDSASFMHDVFAFIRSDRDVKMAVYNQGNIANGPFKLRRYPSSRKAIAAELAKGGWAQYAPELAKH